MKIKKRYLIPTLLVAGFFLGPRPDYPEIDTRSVVVDIPLKQLESHIAEKEAKIENIKPDNQSTIVWADSIRKTEYVVVYLHGFSASPMEGHPMHRNFAKRYGANLYIPRLAGHGINDDDSFKNLSPTDLINSAQNAIAVGRLLGEKVILMTCSTGSTLGLYLAAKNPDSIHSLFLFSPNIDLHDSKTAMLTMPWGKQLAYQLLGEHRSITTMLGTELEKYWTTTYAVEGLICLKDLINKTMTEDILSKVNQPYLLAYYYENEERFDNVVSIDKMKWFHSISATPDAQKQIHAIADGGGHVMICDLQNELGSIVPITYDFAEQVLGLQAIESQSD